MRPAATTALLGAALAVAAGMFDAEPLWVPAVALVLLSTGSVAWVLAGARSLRVERDVTVRRVMEGEPVTVELRVRSGAFGIPTGVLEDPLLPEPLPLHAGRDEQHHRLSVSFGRRGRRVLRAPRAIVRDPLGLAARSVSRGATEAELLVLPRVMEVRAAAGGAGDGQLLAARGRPRIAAEVDLDGVRQMRPGAPASRIYWQALARGGELMERRLQAEADTRPLVVLDPRAPLVPEDLDAAVRAATSLVVHLARAGGCALLLPGDRRPSVLEPGLGGWPHLHVRLALVDELGRPALAGLAARRGPVLYVAARVLRRAPRALLHAPGGGRLLVVPGELPGRRAAFTVAGCHGYELSDSGVRAAVA